MKNELVVLLLSALLAGCAGEPELSFPADQGAGLSEDECVLYGEDYLFALTKPSGWIVDTEVGKEHGIDAVFAPADGSVSIYPQVWQKQGTLTLTDVIEQDLAEFRRATPEVEALEAPQMRLADGLMVSVRRFDLGQGSREAVAYIDQLLVVVVIVLRAEDAAAFERAWPAFEALVQSYRPLLKAT
jgi:pantothenate synthetase